MANKHIIARVSQIVKPSSYWQSLDSVILKSGEIGIDSTLKIYKIGDGVSHWTQLPVYEFFSDADSERLDRAVVEATASAIQGPQASADVTVRDGVADFEFVIPPGEDGKSYTTTIISTNGSTFRPSEVNTTLECHVYQNTTDITDTLGDYRFNWKRKSEDSLDDERWNASSKAVGNKTVTITSADCNGRTVFNCEVDLSGI